ncbi:MAG: Smr/MutS family protein [Muribaculaceae bacterium]|nr:Smr/MutS family protein [Muribaculaceae bacterium]
MIYPSTFENKIGFDKIRRAVIDRCSGALSAEEAEAMAFSDDYDTVRRHLLQTDEMLRIINASLDLPLRDVGDVGASLTQLRAEGNYLSAQQLYRLMLMMTQAAEVRAFFDRSASGDEADEADDVPLQFPALAEVAARLEAFPELIRVINATVNKFGEVKDTASDRLYELRRQLRAASGSLSKTLRRVMDRAVAEGLIDRDTSPSMRDGRMVIPVEAGKKRSLAGIVHDASATGKTVYIEPLEVVEAGNRIRELEMEAHREEVEILKGVAVQLRPHVGAIGASCRVLARLDFIRAKALFAKEVDGRLPVLERERTLELYHAVHPQLLLSLRQQGKEVVPLSLTLNDKQRILIISGPNAGGKSVTLKTVGVVQYMMQCGMLPTVYENSHMGIFRNLYVDIGDEQSIENDLSTYSSHLRNMKYFLQHTSRHTLILADEMGSGTEPQIGGALAQAILDKLSRTRCLGIITTHYQNLKTFAGETEGFINGAMLYDRQHLQPAFQLEVGNPGSSFAVEIARKIGLDGDVIAKAQEIVGSDYVNLDKYLLDIARDRRYWNNKRQSIKEKESRLDDLLSRYEDKADDLKSQRNAILHEARREAKEILATANARIEKAIREIRESQAAKEETRRIRTDFEAYRRSVTDPEPEETTARVPEALKELKHKSKQRQQSAQLTRSRKPATDTRKEIAAGDYVKMKDGNVAGQVIRVEGKRAEVAFGALRMMVELNKLIPSSAPKVTAQTQVMGVSSATSDSSRSRQLNFKPEIDVRGMRGDEAVQAVIYFLDDAVQFNAGRLRILHGTGQGILKTLIRQQLQANPNVVSFRDEDVRFGGAGITVVDLA